LTYDEIGDGDDLLKMVNRYITNSDSYYSRLGYNTELEDIYRNWLRKGIDQATLAMLKNKSHQQEVSRYLSQIRTANTDFVPHFLGANQTREFFIRHNHITL
jgi:hypothetical protein